MSNYPTTITEILDPPVVFRDATIKSVQRFGSSGPWTGTIDQRKEKVERLHADLCRIYGKETVLTFGSLNGGCSGGSFYNPMLDFIELNGKLSVVTCFHEFAHALGKDEHHSCRWSLNLFRECFPKQFERCQQEGHMLRVNR